MRLLLVSAWNDSGGGFTHRLFDGHPELRAWPFELLTGRDGGDADGWGEDWFKGRFRWARLADSIDARDGAALFDLVSDKELKDVLREPADAKHADFSLPVDLGKWRRETARAWQAAERFDQPSFIESYVETFLRLAGISRDDDRRVVAHCPGAILDAPEIWADVPDTLFVCVVRSPLSGFADMRRRHSSLEPQAYAAKWTLVNGAHALWAGKAPGRVRIVTLSDLLFRREATMRKLCIFAGIDFDPVVMRPSWQGRPIREDGMGPFGGVPSLSPEREKALADALPADLSATLHCGTAAVAAVLARMGVLLDDAPSIGV